MPGMENPNTNLWGYQNTQPVGAVADGTQQRLMVQSLIAGGTVGAQPPWGTSPLAQTVYRPFLNGSSPDLRVNGTVGNPVVFSVGSEAKGLILTKIGIMLVCNAFAMTGSKLGGGSLLGLFNGAATNGVLIGATISGAQVTHASLQFNEDFLNLNGQSILNNAGSNPYLKTEVLLNQPLAANSTDALTISIRDGLAGLGASYFRAWACGTRSAT